MYIILFYIYTWILVIKSTLLNEFRCWKVANLDERSDENKNEGGANANGLQASTSSLRNMPPATTHLKKFRPGQPYRLSACHFVNST
jgi:hypothetical protein